MGIHGANMRGKSGSKRIKVIVERCSSGRESPLRRTRLATRQVINSQLVDFGSSNSCSLAESIRPIAATHRCASILLRYIHNMLHDLLYDIECVHESYTSATLKLRHLSSDRFHFFVPDNRPLVLGPVEITFCGCHEGWIDRKRIATSEIRRKSPVGTCRDKDLSGSPVSPYALPCPQPQRYSEPLITAQSVRVHTMR